MNYLKDASLSMRLANGDEIKQIREAIKADKAKFEYIFDKDRVLRLLEESERKLPKPIPSLRDLSVDAAYKLLISGKKTLKDLKQILPIEVFEKVEKNI